MIHCPRCGADTKVTETRDAPSGVRRRRECLRPTCKGRATTMEVLVNQADRIPGGLVLCSAGKLRRMAAVLADVLQEQVGVPWAAEVDPGAADGYHHGAVETAPDEQARKVPQEAPRSKRTET